MKPQPIYQWICPRHREFNSLRIEIRDSSLPHHSPRTAVALLGSSTSSCQCHCRLFLSPPPRTSCPRALAALPLRARPTALVRILLPRRTLAEHKPFRRNVSSSVFPSPSLPCFGAWGHRSMIWWLHFRLNIVCFLHL
jgi:hypothetical protein